MNCNLANGKKELEKIIQNISGVQNRNEAETRFHIIDELLRRCFCWNKDSTVVEKYEHGMYTDYELGSPRKVIWEAKREGRVFELPANYGKNLLVDIESLSLISNEFNEAIRQVTEYCVKRGVQIAVITNGHQIISFLATRFDGVSPLKGKAVVFASLDHLLLEFNTAWQLLSLDGIFENRILKYLNEGEKSIPIKLSVLLKNYPTLRYQNEFQADLKNLSELLIQDLVEDKSLEQKFYENCYCESGALTKYSLISKNILESRYDVIFDEKESVPKVASVKSSKKDYAFNNDAFAEALSRRPIVLIGDVGVGKTSFVKHLIYVKAYEEFNKSIYIYIDLGSQGTLSNSLKDFILNEIERQLYLRYEIDVKSVKIIKGVYSSDIRRFRNGLWGDYYEKKPELYEQKLLEMLDAKVTVKDQYLRDCIAHISKERKRQVIISLDNADQRDFNIQQDAFIIGHELAKEWNAAVFISVRPFTYYKSKRGGAFSAYPSRVFTISPPRIDLLINKRLSFALEMAEGKIPVVGFSNLTIDANNISLFLKALIYSLSTNVEIVELLTNITGGNVRAVIELVKGFIGSPNVDAEKIISIMEDEGKYLIPLHEFSKSALLGIYSHFNPESSVAFNLFDVTHPDKREHFLCSFIVSFLEKSGEKVDRNGFVSGGDICDEMQGLGFSPEQVEMCLVRLMNKKLIENQRRITPDEDDVGIMGEFLSKYRITTIGAYHIKKWIYVFSYIDAMVFDTPIFDDLLKEELNENLESFDIRDRYYRALRFKKYLLSCWREITNYPAYFNFEELMILSEESFRKVSKAIDKY